MDTILLPIDGSNHARRAAEHVVRLIRKCGDVRLHVLHVQQPFPYRSHAFLSEDKIHQLYEQEAREHCASIRQLLDGANIAYTWHLDVGDPPDCIVKMAEQIGADAIVMGTHGLGSFGSLVLGSVATKVIHAAKAPVTLVK